MSAFFMTLPFPAENDYGITVAHFVVRRLFILNGGYISVKGLVPNFKSTLFVYYKCLQWLWLRSMTPVVGGKRLGSPSIARNYPFRCYTYATNSNAFDVIFDIPDQTVALLLLAPWLKLAIGLI
jgi:hypothetical protein